VERRFLSDHGRLWRRHRDRRNRRRNLERGSRHTGNGGKSDNVGLRRGAQGNHRRHGSDLEARDYKELLAVRTNSGRMERRMERNFYVTSIRAVEPIVAKTFPLTEAADALRYLIEGRPFGRVVLTI